MVATNGAGPLARIEYAARLLAEARSVDEIKSVRDMAEAVRLYAKQAGLGLEIQNNAAVVKIRAERRAGELLAAMPKNEGGNPFHTGSGSGPPRLSDVGVSHKQSHRWQAVARVPEPELEAYIGDRKQRGAEITSADVLRMAPPADRLPAAAHRSEAVTLAEWNALTDEERNALIDEAPLAGATGLNQQHTDRIEWAQWSWNPVTGCLHDCPYCYARDIAERFYPQKFEPALVPSRLHAPRNVRVPADAATEVGLKNIFACSMADLFGRWVPQAWIDAVFAEVVTCPQWNFLFLTKFPQRLAAQDWPDNAWVGTSVDRQARVATAERAFAGVTAGVKWLSCEPLLERLTFSSLGMFDWVVIGGSSRSSQTPEFQPPWEWVEHLIGQARTAGCRVYLKPNLTSRPREYPCEEVPR